MKSLFLFVILAYILSVPVDCSETSSQALGRKPKKSTSQPKKVLLSPFSTPMATKPSLSIPHKEEIQSFVLRTLDTLSPSLGQPIDQKEFQDLLQSEGESLTPKKVLQCILRSFERAASKVTEQLDEMNGNEIVETSHLKELTKYLGVFSVPLHSLLTNLASNGLQFKNLKENWRVSKPKFLERLSSQLSKLTLKGPESTLQRELKWKSGEFISREIWRFFGDPNHYEALWLWLSKADCLALGKVCRDLSNCFSYLQTEIATKDPADCYAIELKFKYRIPYLFRRDFIDGNNLKTVRDKVDLLMNGLLSEGYFESLKPQGSDEDLIFLDVEFYQAWRPMYYDGQDLSIWMHNILLDMFERREFVTRREYNDMIERIPDELRRQVYGYFSYVKEGLIPNSEYRLQFYNKEDLTHSSPLHYEDVQIGPNLLSDLKVIMRTSPLYACTGFYPSNDLIKFIYLASVNPPLKFAVFDLLELARLDILCICNNEFLSLFPNSDIQQQLNEPVLQPRTMTPTLKDRVQPEFRKVYKEMFITYAEKLTISQRIRHWNRDLTGLLTYMQVYTDLKDYNELLKEEFRESLDFLTQENL